MWVLTEKKVFGKREIGCQRTPKVVDGSVSLSLESIFSRKVFFISFVSLPPEKAKDTSDIPRTYDRAYQFQISTCEQPRETADEFKKSEFHQE